MKLLIDTRASDEKSKKEFCFKNSSILSKSALSNLTVRTLLLIFLPRWTTTYYGSLRMSLGAYGICKISLSPNAAQDGFNLQIRSFGVGRPAPVRSKTPLNHSPIRSTTVSSARPFLLSSNADAIESCGFSRWAVYINTIFSFFLNAAIFAGDGSRTYAV